LRLRMNKQEVLFVDIVQILENGKLGMDLKIRDCF